MGEIVAAFVGQGQWRDQVGAIQSAAGGRASRPQGWAYSPTVVPGFAEAWLGQLSCLPAD